MGVIPFGATDQEFNEQVGFGSLSIGVMLLLFGILGLISIHQAAVAFAADPICTTSITLRTAAQSGPRCVIYRGSIGRVYSIGTQTTGARSGREHHVVVLTGVGGPVLDVKIVSDFQDRVYGRATYRTRAVVETVNAAAAFIVTEEGSATGPGAFDVPKATRFEPLWILLWLGVSAFLIVLGVVVPRLKVD